MPAGDFAASTVPWPDAVEWSRRELRAYLDAAADPAIQALPTRCPAWSVADLSAHLAATFRRFADQLEKARAGDLAAPFPRSELTGEATGAATDLAATRWRRWWTCTASCSACRSDRTRGHACCRRPGADQVRDERRRAVSRSMWDSFSGLRTA